MNFQYKNKNYSFFRHPKTQNKSLQPWSAADEHLLENIADEHKSLLIYNDRFGFLTCLLQDRQPGCVINYAGQEKAIRQNLWRNGIETEQQLISPLEKIPNKVDTVLLKIPKSLDLFRLQLQHVLPALSQDAQVTCAFMTRHFSKQMISIAQDYFEHVEQSKAWKKSRLLVLKGKKEDAVMQPIIHSIPFQNQHLQQYLGVFSARNIDYASQFLMQHIKVKEDEKQILDLGCGNGVLAWHCRQQSQHADIHVLDDAFLAIESARLNLPEPGTHFHYADNLDNFNDKQFDLVVCNPPFHFEHENNIDISLNLFRQVRRCLNRDGRFLLVANSHLNYAEHLKRIFKTTVVEENPKFVVYACRI